MKTKEKSKFIKRDTFIIVISVFLLTITTIRVSYAAFFEVKGNANIQELTTKELKIIIDKNAQSSDSVLIEEIMPTPELNLPTKDNPKADDESKYADITITNDGGYNAEYVMSISYDDALPEGKSASDLIDLQYVIVGIYGSNGWQNFGNEENPLYYVKLTNLQDTSENNYPILNNTLNIGESNNYQIYIWLDEETPVEEIGKLVYLKLNVESTVLNADATGVVGD